MSIRFSCTGCGRTLKVADELAGRKAKCPQCQAILFIPAGPAAAVTPAPTTPPPRRRAAPPPPPEEYVERTPADDYEEEAPRPSRRRKKKKKSMLVPVLIAVGAALVLLFLAGGGFAAWWFLSGGTQDDYFFLPDNTQMVGTIHVNQLLNSGAVQQAKSQIPAIGTELNSMNSWFGNINPNDIDQVFLGSQTFPSGGGEPNFIVVIHTTKPIKPTDFEALFQKDGPKLTFSETKVGNYTVYDGKYTNSTSSSPPAFTMPDDKRIVLGPSSLLHTVLTRNKKPDLSDKLQAAIKQTDFTASCAFAANAKGAFPKSAPQPLNRPGVPALPSNPFAPPTVSFDKVDSLSVTVKVGNDVDVTATALCQDAASAAELRDSVNKFVGWGRGLLSFAAIAGQGPPADVSNQLTLDLQVNGSAVTASKTILVAPLIKYAKDQANAPRVGK